MKPTAVKKKAGTLRKCRTNPNELQLTRIDGLPGIPERLRGDKRASELWLETTQVLFDMGVLSVVHLSSIASYCKELSLYWEALDMLEQEGKIETTQTGFRSPSPWFGIKNTSYANAMKMAAKFGLYPVDAQKVSAPIQNKPSEDMFH